MIARIWRGWARSWEADAYARYLMATTIPQCRAAPGNRGVYLLRRGDGDRTEFVTIMLWDSLAAMRAFTGENGEPPLPADDARFLVGGAAAVVHYQTIGAQIGCGSSAGWRCPNGTFCAGLVLVTGWARGFPSPRRRTRGPAARTA
jgi:hypothetical protein